jgi:hypothetical protein
MSSKGYRDELAGADDTENHHWVQFATTEVQTIQKTLIERLMSSNMKVVTQIC